MDKMKRGINIRKMLVGLAWCLLGAGLLVLLGAAMNIKKQDQCKGVVIDINAADKGLWFVDKADVLQLLSDQISVPLKGAKLQQLPLRKLERVLERSTWIADAQLYVDKNGVLQVNIREREPVARIFTTNGASFYIDTAAKKLPLSDKTVAKLPVFTGFPVTGKNIARKDSALARDVIALSQYISKHSFWQAQVAQVDIAGNQFEIVPLVGDHIVQLGDASNIPAKFERLYQFYRQVLPKVGLSKYSTVRLQYGNQVVAVKKEGYISRMDSLKVISNIESLIAGAHETEQRMIDSIAVRDTIKSIVQNRTTKN